MSWQNESSEILRILINDFSETPTYSDETLGQLLLAASRYVVQEINLLTPYTIDFIAGSIIPDPSNDYPFLNFMILKSACLTNTWNFNSKALIDGVNARLGPATIETRTNRDLLLALLQEGPCKTFEELKTQFNFGNPSLIKAILSPFTSNNFLPSDIGYLDGNHRNLY